MKRPDDLLGSDNYFHWEFNMRMTLARKGLLDHIREEKKDNEMTSEWRVLDEKAYGIIAQGVQVEHQSKIRTARSAKHAWELLRDYYNRSNLQNRIALTRRLHEFKMEDGSSMAAHIDKFSELVLAMEAVGDPMDQSRQLVILLGSLPAEYETIFTVIENTVGLSLEEVKEKLLKQYEKMQQQEPAEGAFKARHRPNRGGRSYNNNKPSSQQRQPQRQPPQHRGKSRPTVPTCTYCGKSGHTEQVCKSKKREDEALFMAHVTTERETNTSNWLIDSGASSHMSPYREDFRKYCELKKPIEIIIADGKTMMAIGCGAVCIRSTNGKTVKMLNVLHIPSLDRRLLSVPKLTDRGFVTQFDSKSCNILGMVK